MNIPPRRPITAAVALAFGIIAFGAQAGGLLPRPSEHVELDIETAAQGSSCDFGQVGGSDARAFNRRLHPDGTAAPFAVPAGHVPVVTSLIARNQTVVPPGERVLFRVIRFAPDNPMAFNEPVRRHFFADSDGAARARFDFRPGLVVASGVQLCVVAAPAGSQDRPFGASLQGFLARER